MSAPPSHRLRHYAKRLALCLAGVLVALLACEGFLRAIGYYYTPLIVKAGGVTRDRRFEHLFQDAQFVYDPDLIWRPRPNCSVFNRQGFRGREVSPEKPANEFRIFAVGDSNTLGWPTAGPDGFQEANWPACLEKHLIAATERRITVINAGVVGYSSYQGIQQSKRVLPYRPDMILISFGSNDALKVTVCDADFNAAVFRSSMFNLRTGQLVKSAWDRCRGTVRAESEGLVFRVAPDQYRANLLQMIAMCRENGVQCVLLTRPFTGTSTDPLWWKTYAAEYLAATAAAADEGRALLVDVYKHFADKPQCFADECHFTAEGHDLAGKFIAEEIRPLVK